MKLRIPGQHRWFPAVTKAGVVWLNEGVTTKVETDLADHSVGGFLHRGVAGECEFCQGLATNPVVAVAGETGKGIGIRCQTHHKTRFYLQRAAAQYLYHHMGAVGYSVNTVVVGSVLTTWFNPVIHHHEHVCLLAVATTGIGGAQHSYLDRQSPAV